MKERYERPTIIQHVSGLANKFGRAKTRNCFPEIDGVPVGKLVAEYGSPLFVFSERTLRHTYRDALKCFEVRYPKIHFAWSYKTNYLDAVCRVFHSEGAWAEVVSEHEYEMARRLGVPGNMIIFNGPYKPFAALERAVFEEAKIHIDNYDELYALEKIAEGQGRVINIGMRLNLDTGITPSWDRFGFNYDNGDAWDAARRIYAGTKLRLCALHAHIGTFVLEPSAYRMEISKLTEFAQRAKTHFGVDIEYVDVGGGFPSSNTLHGQYGSGTESNARIDDYAEAVTSPLIETDFDARALPTLVLETGRALVDEAGYLLTTVVANKRLPNEVRSLVIDAGVNVLSTAFWYRHEVIPAEYHDGTVEEAVIYGPLCMNIDVVRPSVYLPPVETGDVLVIRPVGAYNVTQWTQFIRMRPQIVMIGQGGQVGTVREAESLDTLKSLERIPSWIEV